MAVFVPAVIVGLRLGVLADLWLRSLEDRRQLQAYVEQRSVDLQLDALTRATISAMRQAAHQASRATQRQ